MKLERLFDNTELLGRQSQEPLHCVLGVFSLSLRVIVNKAYIYTPIWSNCRIPRHIKPFSENRWLRGTRYAESNKLCKTDGYLFRWLRAMPYATSNKWKTGSYVSVNSKNAPAPPPPPQANPREFDFFENFWSKSPLY